MSSNSRPLPPPPSWPHVIATTLRLWVQRHVLPARPRAAEGGRSYRVSTAIVAIVLAAASVAAIATALAGGARPAARATGAAGPVKPAPDLTPSSRALAAAAASRDQAAAWVAMQVSHSVIVGCDPLMCAALLQHGFPSADLIAFGPTTTDPLGTGIVISTAAVRNQLGPGLSTLYAPEVIASFGAGPSLVQVRVATPGGAAAYMSAAQADLQARLSAGRQLAGNSNVSTTAAARAELESGRVDTRLLITMAALAARFRVQIQGFGDGGPGAGDSAPLRQLAVISPSTTYLHQLLAFLDAQRPPLLPTVSAHHHGQATIVQIQFSAPSPTGLLLASVTP
ncbi:MAG TPA: hypothetical protein VK836_00715 [Streptosporangiaceae bacterium]|nr:hypothetical protein [Streptosporangiaceae bacterium]